MSIKKNKQMSTKNNYQLKTKCQPKIKISTKNKYQPKTNIKQKHLLTQINISICSHFYFNYAFANVATKYK